ncbi:ABC transporter substrate-binding protein [soil metagenome]
MSSLSYSPRLCVALCTLALSIATGAVHAADPIKVGVAVDLSGPFSSIGTETRDGIALAQKLLGNQLGGQPVEFIQADTGGSPDQAKQVVDRMIQQNKIQLFTGPVPSNIALAVGPSLFAAKVPYISSNPGPSQYAGAQCNAYFFNPHYQNDVWDEVVGQYATDKGLKSVALIAPNYPAGRDHLTGFKRTFKGTVVNEIYSKVGQLDYAAELAQIRADKPAAIYFFLPGAMGINFIKQYEGAGLKKDTALLLGAGNGEVDTFTAVGGDLMLGMVSGAQWSPDIPNAANQKFVTEFRKAYNRHPTAYAAMGYETILAMDGAVRQLKGDLSDKDALLKAIKAVDYDSPRGKFKMGNNNYPVQDYYLREVVKSSDGALVNKIIATPLKNYQDAYASQCKLS